MLMLRDLDFQASDAEYVRAIELDPNYATGHQWYGELLSAMGRHDEAVEHAKQAERLDPTMIIRWGLARALLHAGRYPEAIERARPEAEGGGSYARSAKSFEFDSYVLMDEYDLLVELDGRWLDEILPVAWRDSVSSLAAQDDAAVRSFLARTVDGRISADDSRPGIGLLGHSAVYWVRVDPEVALDRLERIANAEDRAWARTEWFWMLQHSALDDLRDHPRYLEMDARIRR